jgi:D-alanyl-lipoteichoic acid acyltransferase DltB (MBOAT superfamily)
MVALAPKKGKPQILIIIIYLFSIIALIQVLSYRTNLLLEGLFQFFGLTVATIYTVFLITDRPTAQFFAKSSFLYGALFVITLFVMFMLTQYLPSAWGTVKGYSDVTPRHSPEVFPMVKLSSTRPMGPADLDWEQTSDGTFKTNETIFLLFNSGDKFVLKQASSSKSFMLSSQDIISLEFSIPRH